MRANERYPTLEGGDSTNNLKMYRNLSKINFHTQIYRLILMSGTKNGFMFRINCVNGFRTSV